MTLSIRFEASVRALLAHGLPHVMIANIAQQAVAILGVLVIVRVLPSDEFAMVRIAMAYVAVATVIGAGGLTAPVLRYCADARFSEEVRRQIIGAGLRRMVVPAIATMMGAFSLVFLSGRSNDEILVLGAYALQIPMLAASSLLLVYLQAVQRFHYLAYSQVVIRLFGFLLTSAAAWFYGLSGLLLATLLVAVASVVPLFVAARPLFHTLVLPEDFGSLAKYSVVGVLVTTIGQSADILLLDWVGAERKLVAIYALATIFFMALSALAGSVQAVATPMFTGLISDPSGFRDRLCRWTLGLLAVALPVAVGVVGLAWGLEHWVLGPAYTSLSDMVSILMLRFCLWCTYAVGGAALLGLGAIRQGTWVAVLTTSLAFVVGYPLCLGWGIWGAAWTQVLVALASAFFVWIVIWREMGQLAQPSGPEHGL